MTRYGKCTDCDGAGEKPLFTSCYQCETCGGSGEVPRDVPDLPQLRRTTGVLTYKTNDAAAEMLRQELNAAVSRIAQSLPPRPIQDPMVQACLGVKDAKRSPLGWGESARDYQWPDIYWTPEPKVRDAL